MVSFLLHIKLIVLLQMLISYVAYVEVGAENVLVLPEEKIK